MISIVFKTNGSELVRGGHVIAKHGCWSLLKGGIVANFSSPAEIFLEVNYILLWVKYVFSFIRLQIYSIFSPYFSFVGTKCRD